jgi:hypothetical protein
MTAVEFVLFSPFFIIIFGVGEYTEIYVPVSFTNTVFCCCHAKMFFIIVNTRLNQLATRYPYYLRVVKLISIVHKCIIPQ